MPKHKRPQSPPPAPAGAAADPRRRGLIAFQGGRFDEAIMLWTPLAGDERVRAALAEAHFRRGLATREMDDLTDLQTAVALAPGEMRYKYHLGMRQHQRGELAEAGACYRAVIERGGPRGAALLLALATLEHNPRANLAALPGSTPEILAALAPAQSLLWRGAPAPSADLVAALRRVASLSPAEAEALAELWRGLRQFEAEDPAATATLADQRRLSNARLRALRSAYLGAAAARDGDAAAALRLWHEVAKRHPDIAIVAANLAAVTHARLAALLDAGAVAEAADLALQAETLDGSAALGELRVQALDAGAHLAASAGSWPRAITLWQVARQTISDTPGLGSPRALLHNLALAYEAIERWEEAADSWRAMLRTRPRKKVAESSDGLTDAHWAWVRKRVIDCYKRAGRPDEAVAVFRQMIKAEPNDLDLRLQLADALLANEQEQAAHNEVQRILQIDPQFADAQIRNAVMLSAQGYFGAAENQLRDAIKQHPERDDLPGILARTLLSHAERYIDNRQNAPAVKALEEAQTLDPENPEIPLNLARASFNQRRTKEARAQLERTLALAGDQPKFYVDVFRCWLIERQVDEARAVVARLESAQPPSADLYISLGLVAIVETSPPPEMPNLLFGPPKAAPKPAPPADWTQLGQELLEKGLARQPGDAKLWATAALGLMAPRPELALRYAEEAARLSPNEPQPQILRGLALALNERTREAKDQLQRAAALARRLKMPDVAAEADSLRREVGSPLFRAAYQARIFLEASGIDDDYLEDALDNFF
ncbi:MAG: tetratricopeptide repeat protein [Chloroflexales bacterium]|nr:tetratricopeptide repeat protein [Chloroflexales bacterium]